MITATEIHLAAAQLILIGTTPGEAILRRAISGLYYGLFHELVAAASACFAGGGPMLVGRASRVYDHRTLLAVCKLYSKGRTGPMPEPFTNLLPAGPDQRLVAVARVFVRLQDARQTADYDLSFKFERQEALDLLRLARTAHRNFAEVRSEPETAIFLAALLLNDRWTRRG